MIGQQKVHLKVIVVNLHQCAPESEMQVYAVKIYIHDDGECEYDYVNYRWKSDPDGYSYLPAETKLYQTEDSAYEYACNMYKEDLETLGDQEFVSTIRRERRDSCSNSHLCEFLKGCVRPHLRKQYSFKEEFGYLRDRYESGFPESYTPIVITEQKVQ